jgi:hypothetical protein
MMKVLDMSDMMSEVREGNFLKVIALLKQIATLVECSKEDRNVYYTRYDDPYDFYTSTEAAHHSDKSSSFSTIRNQYYPTGTRQLVKFAEGMLDLVDKDHLTRSKRPLFYAHINHIGPKGYPTGLILECVENTKGIYKRVGVASLVDIHGNDVRGEAFFLKSCFQKGNMPEEVFHI